MLPLEVQILQLKIELSRNTSTLFTVKCFIAFFFIIFLIFLKKPAYGAKSQHFASGDDTEQMFSSWLIESHSIKLFVYIRN